MAGLVPFNRKNNLPAAGIDDFRNMLDDFFNDTFSLRRSFASDTFKLDVQESDREYVIEAELPGVKKDELSLDLSEGRLNITVAREEQSEEKKKHYLHRERRCSSMSRSVYLADAQADGVRAKLDNGVLSITIPKQIKPDNIRKIEID